jgi:hypothetical protein
MRGRSATSTIWKTVVFAGAMLGTAACGGKSNGGETTPDNTAEAAPDEAATPTESADMPAGEDPCAGQDPCAGEEEDPCAGRPRGSEDEEGGVGRGFVLS